MQSYQDYQDLLDLKYKLIYICPERLGFHDNSDDTELMDTLRKLNQKGQISQFVIDEAQTVLSWGKTYRPACLELRQLKKVFHGVPILAQTACLSPDDQKELIF